ncbi:3-hydroxybutyryl- dehydratase [Ophiostoma piceae UAMH 11346]|uniref:3-hydroxybutyryl-dehydratase n=1 Tax=Ophiostoma piceae (strain UAMH 11346) TaxID=1262450 RepID=S3CJU6_OPHP1|nr:3-hydroxybutyryl- dehydratase [Ophiostoma piceae UAMH 11346]
MSFRDEWPTMPDGRDFDGKQLLDLVRSNKSPFQSVWDVNQLVGEVEKALGAQVVDIPVVYKGSNNYGFHVCVLHRPDVVVRLARGDVNMPNFDGFPIDAQVPEARFEVAVYTLLRAEPTIRASRLLYHRLPVQHPGPRNEIPQDIAGRRLFVFERAEGENNQWSDLDAEQKASLLTQAAVIRAALFNFATPLDFAADWLRERLFEQKPSELPLPVAPTRDFCVSLFMSKIEATIRNVGDMIGWEDDGNVVGPEAAAAKQSLLRVIPFILPDKGDQSALYRLVLEHGDFGIHNMSTAMDASGVPRVTSLYDWETGCIVPAILSDPLMAVTVDLVPDKNASAAITRVPDSATPETRAQYMAWADHYFQVLFDRAPDYKRAIMAAKDARHLWFALRDWRGDDPEEYFGALGAWAESRMQELGVNL